MEAGKVKSDGILLVTGEADGLIDFIINPEHEVALAVDAGEVLHVGGNGLNGEDGSLCGTIHTALLDLGNEPVDGRCDLAAVCVLVIHPADGSDSRGLNDKGLAHGVGDRGLRAANVASGELMCQNGVGILIAIRMTAYVV